MEESSARPMIEMHHVVKVYPGGIRALDEVTLSLQKGEFVFLTGPSGAGKSTLIKLLLCMETATSGSILVAGRNLQVLKRGSIPHLRRNVGVVFQDFKLLERRNVYENVAIALEILSWRPRQIRRKVAPLLERLGLWEHRKACPPTLSGGEQQRVAIARALVNDPAILLADEPTGNLDPKRTGEIMEILQECNARQTTVMVATHDPNLLQSYPHRIIVLQSGSITEDRGSDDGDHTQ